MDTDFYVIKYVFEEAVFLILTPCSLVQIHRRFRETCCFRLLP